MSDMHLRNKLRKITEAAKNGEHIPERSKTIGMQLFFIFVAIGILGLLGLTVSLAIYGHLISALISFIITLSLFYPAYKLLTAEEIES